LAGQLGFRLIRVRNTQKGGSSKSFACSPKQGTCFNIALKARLTVTSASPEKINSPECKVVSSICARIWPLRATMSSLLPSLPSCRAQCDDLAAKLAEHGVAKVVPEVEVIEGHARRLIERTLTKKAIDEMATTIEKKAKEIELPADLADRIKQTLAVRSALSWDQATSEILDEILG
jgi:hypothetical protein